MSIQLFLKKKRQISSDYPNISINICHTLPISRLHYPKGVKYPLTTLGKVVNFKIYEIYYLLFFDHTKTYDLS